MVGGGAWSTVRTRWWAGPGAQCARVDGRGLEHDAHAVMGGGGAWSTGARGDGWGLEHDAHAVVGGAWSTMLARSSGRCVVSGAGGPN